MHDKIWDIIIEEVLWHILYLRGDTFLEPFGWKSSCGANTKPGKWSVMGRQYREDDRGGQSRGGISGCCKID